MKRKKKVRFLYFKILIRSTVEQCFIVPLGILYYNLVLRKNDVHSIIVCPHIGDFLFTMGYLKSFKEENQIKHLQVICTEKFERLMHLYPDVECSYKAIGEKWLNILLIANHYESGQKIFTNYNDNSVIEPATGFTLGFDYVKKYPNITLKDCIKYGGLGLSKDSSFVEPSRMNIKKTEKSNAVLICPAAQVIENEEVSVCLKKIVEELYKIGYDIYINGQWDAEGRVPVQVVNWSLEEVYNQCTTMHAVVGLRSGLLDLAVFSGCKVIALYPEDNDLVDFYDIEKTSSNNKNVFQYILTGNLSDDVQNIVEIHKEGNRES